MLRHHLYWFVTMERVLRGQPIHAEGAIQAEYRVNGSNQRDTRHWIWYAPPAAMAELLSAGSLG